MVSAGFDQRGGASQFARGSPTRRRRFTPCSSAVRTVREQMTTSRYDFQQGDADLRRSHDDFSRAAARAECSWADAMLAEATPPVAPLTAPALPALAGTLRACGALLQLSMRVAREVGGTDPIHERPRILRAA